MKCPQLSMSKDDSGKEPNLYQWQNGEKTLGETRLSQGASSVDCKGSTGSSGLFLMAV